MCAGDVKMKKPIKDRLMKRVFKDPVSGCWLWTGCVMGADGYGGFNENRKNRSVHRVSYELFKGEIPKGMCVLHTCDMPPCVNPEHLFLGTPKDNTDDMIRKKRGNRVGAKLNSQIVSEIRLCIGRINRNEIANTYGLSVRHLRRIASNTVWVIK
jgi:hypothetical protein